MKVTIYMIIFLFTCLNLSAKNIAIDEQTSSVDILALSEIYVDDSGKLSLENVKRMNFQQNKKRIINLGIVPQTNIWIKFTLQNTSDSKVEKLLEFVNNRTENIALYYDNIERVDGLYHYNKNRTNVYPVFPIALHAHEQKTFYLKASSEIYTLLVKVQLYNEIEYLKATHRYTLFLFIFFTIIATLLLYNFMIYIFTKDISYLYYTLYMLAIILFDSIYLGIAPLYFFNSSMTIFMTKALVANVNLLVIMMLLFTISFLNTIRFQRLHKILKAYIYLLLIISLLSYDNFLFNLNIVVILIPIALTIIFTGIYAYVHNTKEAFYYLIGWSLIVTSLIISVLKAVGVYSIFSNTQYMNEAVFVFEAFMFSLALAHRIRLTTQAKNLADKKLIEFQKHEQEVLEELVEKKTLDLQASLEEKEILYKELNHRVKNNLGMILSLIKLQMSNTNSKETRNELSVTNSRINSISKLYELLHLQNDTNLFSTETYFKKIVKNIQENFEIDVKIEYDIQHNINIGDSIYCGLILNELVTNSFKYAFKEEGIIRIRTSKEEDYTCMCVEDNGVGFHKKTTNSLGLTIVSTLTKRQLDADVTIDSSEGTKITIKWKERS